MSRLRRKSEIFSEKIFQAGTEHQLRISMSRLRRKSEIFSEKISQAGTEHRISMSLSCLRTAKIIYSSFECWAVRCPPLVAFSIFSCSVTVQCSAKPFFITAAGFTAFGAGCRMPAVITIFSRSSRFRLRVPFLRHVFRLPCPLPRLPPWGRLS